MGAELQRRWHCTRGRCLRRLCQCHPGPGAGAIYHEKLCFTLKRAQVRCKKQQNAVAAVRQDVAQIQPSDAHAAGRGELTCPSGAQLAPVTLI